MVPGGLSDDGKPSSCPLRSLREEQITIDNSQKVETTPNINWWLHQIWHIHTREYYSAIKRTEIVLYLPVKKQQGSGHYIPGKWDQVVMTCPASLVLNTNDAKEWDCLLCSPSRNQPGRQHSLGFSMILCKGNTFPATTREPDGVFSSHEFLTVSKLSQVISKEFKSKFR